MRCALLYVGLFLLLLQQALASNVTLAWNLSPDPQVTNYNLCCGVASGVYTNQVAVGNTSSYQFTGLVPGVTYYFAVKAEDSNGLESPNSNEVNYFVPLLPCNITLGNLNQVYSGQPAVVASSTAPTNLPVTFSYNGSPSAPTNVGTYTVIATVVSTTYMGAATNTLAISPAPATIVLADLVQTCDGFGKTVCATSQPLGLPVVITYNGSSTPPTCAGSYVVACSIANVNYAGSTTNILLLNSAIASITLDHLSQTYDGTAKAVTVATIPSNLAIQITYNGTANAPVNAGSCVVAATSIDPNYAGSATNTLVISKATALLVLTNLAPAYDGTPKAATAVTSPTNLAVNITYDGSATAPTNVGNYCLTASIADTNYAGSTTNTLMIRRGVATVAVAGLSQTYDGTARSVTITTTPSNLDASITYSGSPLAPSNSGSYAVVCTIVDSNYNGSVTNTLTVAQATATVQLCKLVQAWSGNPCRPSVVTVPAGLNVNISYDGSNQPPSDIGYYAVVASINDPNYTGTVSATFRIKTVAPPSKLIIISWSAAFGPVTLLESTNLADWVTNTDLPETASTNPSDTITTPVAIQDGNHFFRAVANGAAVSIGIN